MGPRVLESAGFPGSGPVVTRPFRYRSRSIGTKRSILSGVVTANLPNVFGNFSRVAGLRYCETIEWE